MEWYLYIVGLVLMWVWSATAFNGEDGDPKLFKSFIFALFWPVVFPGLVAGGLILGIVEVISEERERSSSSRSDKGD